MHTQKNELDITADTYKCKYKSGYGVVYPEGHIIRFYERIVKYELGMSGGSMLDFGCGNGTHLCYFMSKGFKVIGIDIVEEAVNQANLSINSYENNLYNNKEREGGGIGLF